MKKIVTFLFFVSIATSLIAQTPESFSYQAITRNSQGDALQNQKISVKMTILAATVTGRVIYEETHQVTTNSFGLINLSVGAGTPLIGLFSGIDWAADSYFLKVEMDIDAGTNYVEIGTSQLLSVPYALNAKTAENYLETDPSVGIIKPNYLPKSNGTSLITGSIFDNGNIGIGTLTPAGKLSVKSDPGVASDIPLFEVKNERNEVVFAVYPEGVRINVTESAKGAGGGFAVGRLGTNKISASDEFFRVTPDSVRVYIKGNNQKATGGGFAVGRLGTNKAVPSVDYLRITPDSTRIYTDDGVTKGSAGGFAVGRLGTNKGAATSYMRMNYRNYFIGHESGLLVTPGIPLPGSGIYNLFLGYQSGKLNTMGAQNVFIGHLTGSKNTAGNFNVFVGNQSGEENTIGSENVFVGREAGKANLSGSTNVFVGNQSGMANTTGVRNVFVGDQAGAANTSGRLNTFVGTEAGQSSSTTYYSTYVGHRAGWKSTESHNTCVGYNSGASGALGHNRAFLGYSAGSTSSGSDNTYLGAEAGYYSYAGENNVYIGQGAGRVGEGSNNVFIGYKSGFTEKGSNLLYIQNSLNSLPLIWGNFAANNEKVHINGSLSFNMGINSVLMPLTRGAYGQVLVTDGSGNSAWSSFSNIQMKQASNSVGGMGGLTLESSSSTDRWKIYHSGIYLSFAENGVRKAYIDGATGTLISAAKKTTKSTKAVQSILDNLMLLDPVKYDFVGIKSTSSNSLGFSAENIQKVFPELVHTAEDGSLGLSYSDFSVLAVKAIQEQQSEIEKLKNDNAQMRKELDEIKQLLLKK